MTEENRPRYDPTINLGHILTMLTIAIGGIGAVVTVAVMFTSLSGEVKLNSERVKLNDIVDARQTLLLDRLNDKIDRFHGIAKAP